MGKERAADCGLNYRKEERELCAHKFR